MTSGRSPICSTPTNDINADPRGVAHQHVQGIVRPLWGRYFRQPLGLQMCDLSEVLFCPCRGHVRFGLYFWCMDIQKRVSDSFARQGFMHTLGARLVDVQEGLVTIECPFREDLTQQHGFFHAGVLTTVADVACGYAAMSVMPEGKNVLSVEFKINLLRPATSDKLRTTGKVIKKGKTLVVCEASVFDAKEETLFAKMQATMICIDQH